VRPIVFGRDRAANNKTRRSVHPSPLFSSKHLIIHDDLSSTSSPPSTQTPAQRRRGEPLRVDRATRRLR
jgi:hypothetical protein